MTMANLIDEPDVNQAVERLKTRGHIQDAVAVLTSQIHGLMIDEQLSEAQADDYICEIDAATNALFAALGVEPNGEMEQRLSEPDDAAAQLAAYHARVL